MIKRKELIKRLNENIQLLDKINESKDIFLTKLYKIQAMRKDIAKNLLEIEGKLFDNYWNKWVKVKKEYRSLWIRIRDDKIRLKNFEAKHTEEEWENLKKKYNDKCACCKKKKKLTKDHIQPISLNGGNSIKNIQPLCRPCNTRKWATKIKYGG